MSILRGRRAVAAGAAALVLAAASTLSAPWAVAQTSAGMISIPLDTVVFGAPGSTVLLDQVSVPAELLGEDCRIESQGENNSSVHPGNDLLVTSDGTTVVLADVEAAPGKITTTDDRLRLGPTATLSVRLGPDGVFSGGATALLVIQCFPDEVPTTTTTTTTSVPATIVSTTTSTTTTTVPVTTTTAEVTGVEPAPPAQPLPVQPSFTG